MSDLVNRLRKMAGIETSALFSQRETLNEAASRISQQEAELERMRRELADMTISRDGYAKQAMAREAEGRRKAFIEAAEIATATATDVRNGDKARFTASHIAMALKKKAEE